MELYLYKTGTHTPLLTVKNVQGYTADRITALDPEGNSVTYAPLGEDCELSDRADCTETLRADWRVKPLNSGSTSVRVISRARSGRKLKKITLSLSEMVPSWSQTTGSTNSSVTSRS